MVSNASVELLKQQLSDIIARFLQSCSSKLDELRVISSLAEAQANLSNALAAEQNAVASDWVPQINFVARYVRDFALSDVNTCSLVTGQPIALSKEDIRDNFSLGLNLKWTIWDSGQRWNKQSELAASTRKMNIEKKDHRPFAIRKRSHSRKSAVRKQRS
jgi:outer membrane protein TolC